MTFQEESEAISAISVRLLQRLEPEPVYVKDYIERECKELEKRGWLEQEGDKPWIRTFERQKYILKVAFVHARRGEHITGADLAFELKDRKVVFIQSKRAGSDGRILFNRLQLQKLIELEGQVCSPLALCPDTDIHDWIARMRHFCHKFDIYRLSHIPLFPVLPLLPLYTSPLRVAFYHLIMTDQGQAQEKFFHTAEIFFTLWGNKSTSQKEFLNQGLKSHDFQKMFWECRIGGPDIGEDIKKDILYFYSLATNRLIIWLDVAEK